MADNYNTLVLMFGQGTAFGGTEVDYDSFMEEFRRDYSRQIAMTADQLKSILNEKNVNGKGEQLAEAMKITLEKRLSKTIEQNRDVYGSKSHVISPEVLTLLKTYQESGTLPKLETAEDVAEETVEEADPEVVEKAEEAAETAEQEVEEVTPEAEEQAEEAAEVAETAGAAEAAPREIGEEFFRYGSLEELKERLGDSANTYVQALLSALEHYEEVMETCGVEQISEAIAKVREAAQAVRDAGEMEEGVTEFAAKAAERFAVEDDSVLALVKWCVAQGKIRQAAEVYAELMPQQFFEEKILYFEDYHEARKNDNSYGDSVIDAKKQAKSKKNLKYFWLNEMLWTNFSKKLFLNVDKPILGQDGANARRFKVIFREIKELQETRKNQVQIESLPEDMVRMFDIIAKGGYISPVLNTPKKVCNYFFNYEATGTAGSVQKSYRDLSLILLSNKDFTEEYFGEESVQIVTFTPASFIMNKEQSDVKSKLSVTELEKVLRIYEKVKEQVAIMGHVAENGAKRMNRGELKELLMAAVENEAGGRPAVG